MTVKNNTDLGSADITVKSKEELKSVYRELLQHAADGEILVINVKEAGDDAEENDNRTD
jgi:hypothetical protein